ncbi:MAG: putative zinc-binding peptidase [Cytophagales bacterium]|nr:putative zinc-binding peptidase [Cytophagales bacterium]
MKLFKCTHCGQLLYFENIRCEQCSYPLGFLGYARQLVPLVPAGGALYRVYDNGPETYRYCANHDHGACNWLVPDRSGSPYCEACALNRTVPDLSVPEYVARWRTIEVAKHRLVYTLLRMGLPPAPKTQDPVRGLAFDFLADQPGGERVLTGHAAGLVTLNIAEADDLEREKARKLMGEPYRTLLGHFRHEVGHYYWDQLISGTPEEAGFRAMFGDERADYGEALKRHYAEGAPPDWPERFISAYASMHPWEDWAETWAHYLHILDTLETAYAFGLRVRPGLAEPADGLKADIRVDPYHLESFDALIGLWLPLSFAVNSLNRSMGHPDLYPFVIPPAVMEKLRFIHSVCLRARLGETLVPADVPAARGAGSLA